MKVCMLAYSFYETDARIIRYSSALVERGDEVDVIALRSEDEPGYKELDSVKLYAIQERTYNETGKFSFLFRLLKFLIKSFIFLTKRHLKNRYKVIHVHNVPDFLVFAALFPKILGAKIILDIHDILPEFYISKFNGNRNSLTFRLLCLIEKVSIAFSDHVVVSNHIWQKKLISRSLEKSKCTVMMNFPDLSIFFKRPRERESDKFIIIYPGSLNWHQGVDIAVKAFSLITSQIPQAELHIYGEGAEKTLLESLISKFGLENKVFFKKPLPQHQIANVMANADLGIVPKRNDAFGGEAFSTKILQFMALGVPVIVSETKIDRYYFNDSVVHFFKPEDEKDLAKAMLEMVRNETLRKTLVENASKFVEDFSWDKRKSEYLDLVDRLTSRKC